MGTLIGIAAIVELVLLIRWMVKGVNPPSQTDIAKASAKGHSKVFLVNRDRGEPIGSAPPTPPGMRVRTGRFEKLRYQERRGTPNRSK